MIAIDTSVAVAAFASWHEQHEAATQILERQPRLPTHVAVETYSVLTRLPAPHRASPTQVQAYLAGSFAAPWLGLSEVAVAALVAELATAGISGGAAYDALVGATAREAGATLISTDRRAETTYRKLGVQVEFLP